MRRSELQRRLLTVQGAYYLATGIWPFVHLRSFLAVTGPKTDIWLLKTLSLLICAAGFVLLRGGRRARPTPEVRDLAGGSALALLGADLYYVARGTISPAYLVDAVAEAPFLAAWALSLRDRRCLAEDYDPNATSINTAASSASSPNSLATSSS